MKTRFTKALLVSLLLGMSGIAHSATVTFSNIVDGNGLPLLFDPATTAPDAGDGNILNIGLTNFSADGGSIVTSSAVDTLSMIITAPAGYVITSVAYTEAGSGETTGGVAFASGSIVADGIPTNFLTQVFAPQSSSGWSISPTPTLIANKDSIAVSITNSLIAFSFTPADVSYIEKSEATLTVSIAAIPVPAAAWLFGSALIALVGIQRRKA